MAKRVSAVTVIAVWATLSVGCGAASPVGSRPPGSAPRPGPTAPITEELRFPRTTVRVGGELSGILRIHNSTDQTVNLTRTCMPTWDLVLRNARFVASDAMAIPCTMRPFLVRPGATDLPVSFSPGGAVVSAADPTHRIVAMSTPPGTYIADVQQSSWLDVPLPAPVTITVTP